MSARPVPPRWWNELLQARRGIATWDEVLRAGQEAVALRHLAAGAWHRPAPGIVVTGPPPLSLDQWHVVAVLHGGPGAALGGVAALSSLGLVDRQPHAVDVYAPRGVRRWPMAAYHRPRGDVPVQRRGPVDIVVPGLAAVQAVVWAPTAGVGGTVLRMALQQRVVTVGEVAPFVLPRTRRRSLVLQVLDDVLGSATTSTEALLRREWARRPGLPPLRMQVPFTGDDGLRRVFDAVLDPRDFTGLEVTLVFELDGTGHLEAGTKDDDDSRTLQAAGRRVVVLRRANHVVRADVAAFADQMLRLAKTWGWQGH